MDAKTLFDDKLPLAFSQSPQKAKELNAIFQFNITGANGGQWTLDLKADPPVVKKGAVDNADCAIEVSDEDFQGMLQNPQMGIQLYFQGKLKVVGDPMLATKLQNIFGMVKI
jgi:putative sterol carrier protein